MRVVLFVYGDECCACEREKVRCCTGKRNKGALEVERERRKLKQKLISASSLDVRRVYGSR
jgi:hypothetical protein